MLDQSRRNETNWLEVAADRGLMPPSKAVLDDPGQFGRWVHQVRIVHEIEVEHGCYLQCERDKADRLARAEQFEDA